MLAAKSVKEHNGDQEQCNIINVSDHARRLLKSAAIYGANASGKSNLISAMSFFKKMILESFKNDSMLYGISINAFQFCTDSLREPISFEMQFIVGTSIYRYGFEIKDEAVETEWLFVKSIKASKESYCFRREKQMITVNAKTYKKAGGISSKTRPNALFLSTCAQFNVQIAMEIKEWFRRKFNILSGIDDNTIYYTTAQYMHNQDMHDRIIDFIKLIDLGINDITVKESSNSELPTHISEIVNSLSKNPNIATSEVTDIKKVEIFSEHKCYKDGTFEEMRSTPFGIESLGTKKIFALLGPWFDTVLNGGVLLIDEFGASLHTKLTIELLKIFQSELNTQSQLVITTHDTNLLRGDLLRRDQIWFTEKDEFGASSLFSLVEYKINQASSVRNDASFGKDYLMGKYGAIPYFGNIRQFITDYSTNGK